MMITASQKQWIQWVKLTSHPLRQIDGEGNPTGFGSATLIDYKSKRFALTAHHVVPLDQKGWSIEVSFSSSQGTELYTPKRWMSLVEYRKSKNELAHVDFSFAEVSTGLSSMYQERTPFFQGEEVARHVFASSEIAEPEAAEIYGFSGETKPEMHSPRSVAMQMNVFPGIKYVGFEDEILIFKLPISHPGHPEFRGCSGAPIVDTHRRLVGIVVRGDEIDDSVRAVSISRLLPALDIYCSKRADA